MFNLNKSDTPKDDEYQTINKHTYTPKDVYMCVHAMLILAISLTLVETFWNTNEQPKPIINEEIKVNEPSVEENNEPTYSTETIEKFHNALGLALHIDQSCYDAKNDLWLVHSVIPAAKDGEVAGWDEGWYYDNTDKIRVLSLTNNTYSITNVPEIFNNETFPDITGLQCKQPVLRR
jgi:hypothetical protein